MVDRQFSDPELASLYDVFHPFGEREDFGFYMPLVMASEAVLDVGCGTGALLRSARDAGHSGRLCGLDPADAMLARGRRYRDIEWVSGDLSSECWEDAFDLIVMTGHAFQVFTEDAELQSSCRAVRQALTHSGRFVFETRNPAARAWESWTPDQVARVTAAGAIFTMSHEVDTSIEGDVIRFTTTFESPHWPRPRVSRSALRFLDAPSLARVLTASGLRIVEQFGDWDRRPLGGDSPEIITVAQRA